MAFLGLDLSLSSTGAIRVEKGKITGRQLIKVKPRGAKPSDELQRLQEIRDSINVTGIEFAVIEGLAFMARNTTALCQLAGLNYLVREYLQLSNIPFAVVAPSALKKFVTGKGNCNKDLVLLETYKRYGESFDSNDLCDAFVLAMIGEALLTKDIKLTKPQQEVISVVRSQL